MLPENTLSHRERHTTAMDTIRTTMISIETEDTTGLVVEGPQPHSQGLERRLQVGDLALVVGICDGDSGETGLCWAEWETVDGHDEPVGGEGGCPLDDVAEAVEHIRWWAARTSALLATRWSITEAPTDGDPDVWQDYVVGSLADAWQHVGDTILGGCMAPSADESHLSDGSAMWPGRFAQLDQRSASVTYWHNQTGEGPVRVDSIITISPVG